MSKNEESPLMRRRVLPRFAPGVRLVACPKCGSVGLHSIKYGVTDVGPNYNGIHESIYVPSISVFCHSCEVPLGPYAPLDYVREEE